MTTVIGICGGCLEYIYENEEHECKQLKQDSDEKREEINKRRD